MTQRRVPDKEPNGAVQPNVIEHKGEFNGEVFDIRQFGGKAGFGRVTSLGTTSVKDTVAGYTAPFGTDNAAAVTVSNTDSAFYFVGSPYISFFASAQPTTVSWDVRLYGKLDATFPFTGSYSFSIDTTKRLTATTGGSASTYFTAEPSTPRSFIASFYDNAGNTTVTEDLIPIYLTGDAVFSGSVLTPNGGYPTQTYNFVQLRAGFKGRKAEFSTISYVK